MLKSTRELKEKFFSWSLGRQSNPLFGDYYKMLLVRFSKLELHIIKIPEGTKIKTHVDPVRGFEHHRLNITLFRPRLGGHFYRSGGTHDDKRFIYFRPDRQLHGLTRVHSGTMILLSLGWVRK